MIGGGGMANVYLARDIILDRDVAIKVLRLEYANDDEFIARFHREAQAATSLAHPNIVNIYDVGEEDNIYFMVMEYVDGMTLKKYIQTYGPVEVQEAIDIMKQITSAITHAHENDIVHRDIKPQNILIDPYGSVKVTDFGIAVALSATSLTQTNSVLGSVHYLSPEQARGGMANKKSDIYSLGIVLFELLTGRLPFSGQSAVSIALKHLQSNTPSIRRWNPAIPQSLENIVLKATTKDPFHRYDAVYEMEDALEVSLHPANIDEELFLPPEDSGEETKAIPIITDETFKANKSTQDTIIHNTNNMQKIQENNSNSEELKDKKKNKKKKKKGRKIFMWVSIISIMVIMALFAALFIIPNMLQPKDVIIPELEGVEYEEAVEQLTALELEVEEEPIYSDDIPEGYVVKTNPEANDTIKEGRTVTVFTSQGQEKVTFEDYVGRDYNQIERLLEQTGYEDIQFRETHSDKPVGEIITQYQPQPGDKVVPKQTTVIFEISVGPAKVNIKDLVGMTEEDARSYLRENNLLVDKTEANSEDVEKGLVISQSPKANSEIEEKSYVQIVVSLGPKEKPPLSQLISFNVPYTGNKAEEQNEEGSDDNATDTHKPQEIRIYVGDKDHDIEELFQPVESIAKDKEFTIRLTIAPGETAHYKVMRDDTVIINKSVSYKDLEGE